MSFPLKCLLQSLLKCLLQSPQRSQLLCQLMLLLQLLALQLSPTISRLPSRRYLWRPLHQLLIPLQWLLQHHLHPLQLQWWWPQPLKSSLQR